MRLMIQVRATLASEAGGRPDDDLLAAKGACHEELANSIAPPR
ncbi:hypothetical protein [Burkholderia perseverans]|nr:hypothetical protein [Burkholderia perseverans]